jgi:hypothetical protein
MKETIIFSQPEIIYMGRTHISYTEIKERGWKK